MYAYSLVKLKFRDPDSDGGSHLKIFYAGKTLNKEMIYSLVLSHYLE